MNDSRLDSRRIHIPAEASLHSAESDGYDAVFYPHGICRNVDNRREGQHLAGSNVKVSTVARAFDLVAVQLPLRYRPIVMRADVGNAIVRTGNIEYGDFAAVYFQQLAGPVGQLVDSCNGNVIGRGWGNFIVIRHQSLDSRARSIFVMVILARKSISARLEHFQRQQRTL